MPRDDDRDSPRFGRLTLDEALETWRDEWETDPEGTLAHGHASTDELRSMAGPGGLAGASPELLDHTSRCPRCLAEWAALVRATTASGEPHGAPGLDYGLYEAAATRGAASSRTLRTESGTYVLTLSPGTKDSSRGLVILEVTSASAADFEGRRIRVRTQASGEVLLDGIVRRGYLAQRHEALARIDLSRGWTVVVDL